MTRTRTAAGPPPRPGGWYFVRPSGPVPGRTDHRWTVVRVTRGGVRPHGTSRWYAPTAPFLRDAEWVRINPPGDGSTTAVGRRRPTRAAAGPCVQEVAAGIVDAFVAPHRATAAYYDRHPAAREELVALVARLIHSARG